MENFWLQFGVLGGAVFALGLFARQQIDRMNAREDAALEEKKVLIQNNTAAMNAVCTRLDRMEYSLARVPCIASPGPRMGIPGNPSSTSRSEGPGAQTLHLSQAGT